ncbi:unnamed protein product, partial [Medioppia subpectinata]
GVYLEHRCGKELAINIVLTMCGVLPGIVHALANISQSQQTIFSNIKQPTMSHPNPCFSVNTALETSKLILDIIMPPVGVGLEKGCGKDLAINIVLTMCGVVPGMVHALF